jgi:hypothetical protein
MAENKLDKTLREMGDHLGFLGYESEVKEGKLHPYLFLRHLRNPNFAMDLFGGAVKCVAFFKLSGEGLSKPPELLTLLAEVNQRANALKFYTDEDSLVLELVFPHEYSKTSFGSYWSLVESDFRLISDGRFVPFLE